MKRFIAVLGSLLILPAFAEVAPVYLDDATEYADEYVDENGNPVDVDVADEATAPVTPVAPASTAATNARVSSTRTGISRTVPAGTSNTGATRNAPSRAVASRNTAMTPTRTAVARPGASRATSAGSGTQSVTARSATPATTTAARAATTGSLIQTNTVSSPLYIGRVSTRGSTNVAAGVRSPTVRSNTTTTIGTSTVTDTGPSIDEIAEMTEFCKAQYTNCMDNFCNILDDNQGRCSCSGNIKNYAKTEEALKNATTELQDVAQKIQYIGLTKDEVATLFSQTEAEAAMQGKTDTTQLKNDLDKVKNMIIGVKSGSSTNSDTSMGIDLSGLLDFSISSTGFDLSTLFGTNTNTNSISNQRGAELYKTATARCKTAVIDSCRAKGVDIAVVTNSYDLEIDKQCIVYERDLSDANTNMTNTVRNAKSVLQKARLVVAQNKNSYDMRGCVTALDTCMQDDFVCGSDYENCLDPTGKFIVNGTVVIGSQPGAPGNTTTIPAVGSLYRVWNYSSDAKNAWVTVNPSNSGTLGSYIDEYAGLFSPVQVNTSNLVHFLEQKIGYNESGKNFGMCISVLNKCQDYTYTGTGAKTYKKGNDVIKNYLQRTLIQIKAKQDDVLSKYAEGCISEVAACLSTNNYGTSPATAQNACNSIITTCASVTGVTTTNIVSAATSVAP